MINPNIFRVFFLVSSYFVPFASVERLKCLLDVSKTVIFVGSAVATRHRLLYCLAKCGGSGLKLHSVACLSVLANELRLSGSNLLRQKSMESGVEQRIPHKEAVWRYVKSILLAYLLYMLFCVCVGRTMSLRADFKFWTMDCLIVLKNVLVEAPNC